MKAEHPSDNRQGQNALARALNTFFDFKRDVIYVYALRPVRKESAPAVEQTVQRKEGLDPNLASLVTSALAQRDQPLRQR